MRLHPAVLVALIIAPTLVAAQEHLGAYEDRIAVEDVMARYVWAVDSLDPEGYVAVFTENAIIDSNGNISRGREEIRKIVLIAEFKFVPPHQQRAHYVPEAQRGFAPVVLADCVSRQGRQDDGSRDGPLRRPTRQAQWQMVDSDAQADRFHRMRRRTNRFVI
jgi:hypothetical protein